MIAAKSGSYQADFNAEVTRSFAILKPSRFLANG
jgi:hypothetical protein